MKLLIRKTASAASWLINIKYSVDDQQVTVWELSSLSLELKHYPTLA
jgi:hypothetical protein